MSGVHETDHGGSHERAARSAFSGLDLISLVSGAARLRPERLAWLQADADESQSLTFRALDRKVIAMAIRLNELGLAPGERLMVIGDGSAAAWVTLLAGLAAGLDVAVASPQLDDSELADFARRANPAALAGVPRAGERAFVDTMFAAAMHGQSIRLVMALSTQDIDSVLPLDPLALEPPPERTRYQQPGSADARIITRDSSGAAIIHHQHTLVACTMDYIARVHVGIEWPVISTLVPASMAGLVAAPVASLLSGASAIMIQPFGSLRLATALNQHGPAHLVIPASLSAELCKAGLHDDPRVGSLVLLTRYPHARALLDAPHPPVLASARSYLSDLYAIGEGVTVAEPRNPQGEACPPLATPHFVPSHNGEVLVARLQKHYLTAHNGSSAGIATADAGAGSFAVSIEGAGVSRTGDAGHGDRNG